METKGECRVDADGFAVKVIGTKEQIDGYMDGLEDVDGVFEFEEDVVYEFNISVKKVSE